MTDPTISDPLTQFSQIRTELAEHLTARLEQYYSLATFPFDRELLKELGAFSTRGKMLRGVGFVLLAKSLGFSDRTTSLDIGAALEMFQSGLLIHDDIMDHDEKRRGQKSLYKLYHDKAATLKLRQPENFGLGVGICGGDMTFFIAYDLLSNSKLEEVEKMQVLQVTNRELLQLGMSQIQDSYLAAKSEVVDEADILQMYVGKTARYTWRWPLLLAAATTNQPLEVQQQFSHLADQAGLLFQLKDDELGLFGDTKQTGKNTGSDIQEGKKTLYWLHLQELAQSDQSLQSILSLFGQSQVQDSEIHQVQQTILDTGIKQQVEQRMAELYERSTELITALTVPPEAKAVLSTLLNLTYHRSS